MEKFALGLLAVGLLGGCTVIEPTPVAPGAPP